MYLHVIQRNPISPHCLPIRPSCRIYACTHSYSVSVGLGVHAVMQCIRECYIHGMVLASTDHELKLSSIAQRLRRLHSNFTAGCQPPRIDHKCTHGRIDQESTQDLSVQAMHAIQPVAAMSHTTSSCHRSSQRRHRRSPATIATIAVVAIHSCSCRAKVALAIGVSSLTFAATIPLGYESPVLKPKQPRHHLWPRGIYT